MPWMPSSANSSLTASSLCGLMMASIICTGVYEHCEQRPQHSRVASSDPRAECCLSARHWRAGPVALWMRGFCVLGHDHAAVTGDPHFGHIQAFNFHVFADAIANDHFDGLEDDKREDGQRHEAGRHADQFGPELSETASIEQARHISRDAIITIA